MSKNVVKAKSPFKKANSRHSGEDIIQIILKDHKPLWKLIKVMKSEKATYSEKRNAFEIFAPTLIAHAKPEEQTWYKQMKSENELVVHGLEGDVEHGLADKLCEELKRTQEQNMFMAKVKVLAELVEHHLEEEEEDMLPKFKKDSTKEERLVLGEKYLKIQKAFLAKDREDSPSKKSRVYKQMETTAQESN